MALRAVDGLIGLGNIFPAGQKGLLDTHTSPQQALGAISFMQAAGGFRAFRYVRFMQSGGMARGELCDRVALVSGTVDATGTNPVNDTTHATDGANFTATNEVGKVFQVNVAAATAREGQVAFIIANSADVLTFDTKYPLSAAATVGDTYSDWAANHYDDAVAASNRINVGGIVMGDPAANEYGWVQNYGFHPAVFVDVSGGAVTAGAKGVSGAASVLVGSAETMQAYIGWFPMATSTTAVQAAFFVDCWDNAAPVA